MHSLLLSARVDRHDARIHDHHDSDDQMMLFQNNVRDQWHQIQSLVLVPIQLSNNNQQICPCKDGAASFKQNVTLTFDTQVSDQKEEKRKCRILQKNESNREIE